MGARGPKPAPLAEQLRKGVRPSRLNLAEPLPRQRAPIIPAHLSPEARVVWRAVLREAAPGQVVRLDGFLLEQFAVAVIEWRLALVTYQSGGVHGLIRARGDGRHSDAVVVHPILRVLGYWSGEVQRLGQALGLSPSARASLRIGGEDGLADSIEATIGPAPRLLRAVNGDEP